MEYKKLTHEHKAYLRSDATHLSDVYGRWSSAKQSAYDYCRNLFDRLDGKGFTIVSSNTFMFTVGFDYKDLDTGEDMFAYITRDHDYCCPYSKL